MSRMVRTLWNLSLFMLSLKNGPTDPDNCKPECFQVELEAHVFFNSKDSMDSMGYLGLHGVHRFELHGNHFSGFHRQRNPRESKQDCDRCLSDPTPRKLINTQVLANERVLAHGQVLAYGQVLAHKRLGGGTSPSPPDFRFEVGGHPRSISVGPHQHWRGILISLGDHSFGKMAKCCWIIVAGERRV